MPTAAFPATARLRQSQEYRAVFARGERFVSRGFVLIAAPGTGSGARLGLALAKRHIARAVDRNRVKRVLRESFRLRRHGLDGFDIVVLARGSTATFDNRTLFAQLDNLWERISAQAGVDRARLTPR